MALTPLQRHPALVPLSHDHHQGLMAAVRLKRGDTAYSRVQDLEESIRLLWSEELAEHFRQEEDILFAETGYPEDVQEMIVRALEEHRAMQTLVANCTDANAPETGRQLGALLESHIRFEERQMFPAMQDALGPERLGALEGRMVAGGKCVR